MWFSVHMNPTPLTRTFKAPAQRVYDAWTKPELFKQLDAVLKGDTHA